MAPEASDQSRPSNIYILKYLPHPFRLQHTFLYDCHRAFACLAFHSSRTTLHPPRKLRFSSHPSSCRLQHLHPTLPHHRRHLCPPAPQVYRHSAILQHARKPLLPPLTPTPFQRRTSLGTQPRLHVCLTTA